MNLKIDIEKLRFPIGKFVKPEVITNAQLGIWISEIQKFPSQIINLTNKLTEKELNWKYRPDGWTIKQVVHHCADSHMNSFIRFKFSLTENTPTIKPYFEDKWAELPDTIDSNIIDSIKILEGLHSRWTVLLKSLSPNDLKKDFIHPEHVEKITIEENIGIYAWHSNHHLAHINQAINYKGSFN